MSVPARTQGPAPLAAAFAVCLAVASAPGEARAQQQQFGGITFKEPTPYRVYQRGRDNLADVPVVLAKAPDDAKITGVSANGVTEARFEDGKVRGLPPGTHELTFSAEIPSLGLGGNLQPVTVIVGDLWVLAGQSNMEGVGDLVDVTPPIRTVTALGMDGKWVQAREPLHWLVDSPDPVHSGNPDDRQKRSASAHKNRRKGAGLGLPFASELTMVTGVPIGLVACAHGGTSMAQWDPAKKDEGGQSLYGSMVRQVNLAGGKVKGVLWYQGESDADEAASAAYPKVFADFIAAVRSDLGQPELPFYFVQIGRVVRGGDPKWWNAVQDAERRAAEEVPNAAVVASIDLELDDGIHIGTDGLKRLGARLARVAERELFGMVGGTTPAFDRVNKGAGNTLVVKLKGVNLAGNPQNIGLTPSRHISGFSIRQGDGKEIPLIYDAAVGPARDTVVLKLNGKLPADANLWYGHGFDPYCNLTDGLDMALPVFGPVPLDKLK